MIATGGLHSPGPAAYELPPSVGGKQAAPPARGPPATNHQPIQHASSILFTYLPSATRPQPDGRKPDPPVWGIGTAQRFPKRRGASTTPGPGTYERPPASVGPQARLRARPTAAALTDRLDLARLPCYSPGCCLAQVLGRYRSEPSMGFGSAKREHMEKVFVSQEHQKSQFFGACSPGPTKYTLMTTLEPHPDARIRSAPQVIFTSAKRTEAESKLEVRPGPQKYMLPSGLGPQVDSTKKSAGTPIHSVATRDTRAKLFIGADHAKSFHGGTGPGPAARYELTPGIGRQIVSKYRSAPGMVFTKASRWAKYEREQRENTTPGPGAY